MTESDEIIRLKVDVICHAYDIKLEDNWKGRGYSEIHMWCLDKKSNPILLRLKEPPIFCYLELPQYVNDFQMNWTSEDIFRLMDALNYCLKDDKPISNELVYRKKIYYYQGEKTYPMLKLYFNNLNAMIHCMRLVKGKTFKVRDIGLLNLEVWETDISPIRKFYTMKECRLSQWVQVVGEQITLDDEERASIPGNKQFPIQEYFINFENFIPLDLSLTTKPRLLSWDIETYSDNHLQMPKEMNAKHCAYLISFVYQQLGDLSSRKRYVILMGDCNEIPICEKIIKVNSEPDLIHAMSDLVLELDPEILTGYNIFGYDYKYLGVRLKTFLEEWRPMGRLIGRIPVMFGTSWSSSAYGHNEIKYLNLDGRISADMLPIIKRDYKLDKYTLDFSSEHFLDKKKHDIKAPAMFKIYELMVEAIKNGSIEEKKIAFSEMSRVVAYCVQDSELAIDLFEYLNVWVGLIELSNIVGVTIIEIFTRGQQVRCKSQIYDLASKSNYVLNQRNNVKMVFNGAFVFEPVPGLHENIICLDFASLYPSIMRAYNICYTTLLDPESTIPDDMCHIIKFDQKEPISGKIKNSNFDATGNAEADSDSDDEDTEKKFIIKHYKFRYIHEKYLKGILPQLEENLVNERNQVRKKAKVLEKQQKFLELIINNFSEYENITKLIESINLKIPICEAEIVKISELYPNLKEKKFPKKDLRKIFEIREHKYQLESFLELINNYDISSFETLKSQLLVFISNLKQLQVVLDKRQNALKVSANSMFGFLGVQNGGILPLIEGAMSITARGRQLIGKVNTFLETEYSGKVVYNDTDSVMIDLNITDMKECQKWGDLLMAVISGTPEEYDDNGVYVPAKAGLFPHPLKMEFEKAMRMLCIRKKKYAAYLIDENGEFETDGKGKNKVLKKGIMIARRDNHKFSRDTYLNLLMAVLDKKDIDYSYNITIKSIITLLRRQIQPKGNLSIIRGLGAEYKSEGYFMKVFAGELSRMGRPAEPGERLEYVVVKTQEEKLGYEVPLGKKMRTVEMWEESWNRNNRNKEGFYPPENIDSLYYIKNTMMKPLDQLFSVCYSKELKKCKAENIGYQPQYSRCKFSPIVEPAKMMCSMIEDFLKFYKNYPEFSEDEKFSVIADQIEKLPEWFKQKRFEGENIKIN